MRPRDPPIPGYPRAESNSHSLAPWASTTPYASFALTGLLIPSGCQIGPDGFWTPVCSSLVGAVEDGVWGAAAGGGAGVGVGAPTAGGSVRRAARRFLCFLRLGLPRRPPRR